MEMVHSVLEMVGVVIIQDVIIQTLLENKGRKSDLITFVIEFYIPKYNENKIMNGCLPF